MNIIRFGSGYVALVTICLSAFCLSAVAQNPQAESDSVSSHGIEFSGRWTIRFYRADSSPSTRPEEISFGCWQMSFDKGEAQQLTGTMEWDGWPLRFEGTAGDGTDRQIELEASGKIGDETWSIRCEGARPRQVASRPQLSSSLMGTALISRQFSNMKGGRTTDISCHWIAIKQSPEKLDPIEWTLESVNDRRFDFKEIERTTVLVFSKGFSCVHCNEQIGLLNRHSTDFLSRNVEVIFVVSDTLSNLKNATSEANAQFEFLSDPSLVVFSKYGLDENLRSHGIVVVDADRDIKWSVSGKTPFMDIDELLKRIEDVNSDK